MESTRGAASTRHSQNYAVGHLTPDEFQSDYGRASPCLAHPSTRQRRPRRILEPRGGIMRVPSARIAALLSVLGVLSACTDRAPAPTGLGIAASRRGVPFAASLVSPPWQAMA